jgi:tetratricopeptide (TPR) repeat protein
MQLNADRREARAQYGSVMTRLGRIDEAARQFAAALAIDPSYAPAYLDSADAALAQGNEAAVSRKLCAKVSAKRPALRHALGLSLVGQHRLAEAPIELNAAARATPANARFG